MIYESVVAQLVPPYAPETYLRVVEERRTPRGDLPYEPTVANMWAAALRARTAERMREDERLEEALYRTALVGTGIFQTLGRGRSGDMPPVDGYQFGVVLFTGGRARGQAGEVEVDGVAFPVVEQRMQIEPHRFVSDGRIAAYDINADPPVGITAGHVVDAHRPGDRVPLRCERGGGARLLRCAPGYVDAALVEMECHCAPVGPVAARPVGVGDAVQLHLGRRKVVPTRVMMAVDAQPLLSAAVPQNFLTSEWGRPGQSGSLVSTTSSEPCGIYLGKHNAEDEDGRWSTYGHAGDLRQAARLLGVDPDLLGVLDA
ncbi:hypothetical protein [Isoptericola sp. 178]|uniref:hypothetical protein n=1 Tax=Isoptericola sp. 178 TaxID=3064651 RepID=UPI002712BD71|nr:hypothetical protein [Isoptericola sp. 178]MDO8145301.1 hypothetical protein [Isoptericola sp. 178]